MDTFKNRLHIVERNISELKEICEEITQMQQKLYKEMGKVVTGQ